MGLPGGMENVLCTWSFVCGSGQLCLFLSSVNTKMDWELKKKKNLSEVNC